MPSFRKMDSFHDFVDVLSTNGGAIFLLFIMWLIAFSVTVFMMIKGFNGEYKAVIMGSVFGGLTSALLAKLGNKDKVGFNPTTPVEEPLETALSKGTAEVK